MANDISGGVWRLDTVPFSYNATVKIVNLVWTDEGALGDSLVLQTISGKPIVDAKAAGADSSTYFGFFGWVPSLRLVTLTSGVVMISVGAGR